MRRAIALGFFDGVHLGHAALLNKTKQRAKENNLTPSVMSFDVHPDTVVFGKEVPLIGNTESRREIINRCFGIKDVIFIHFSNYVKDMPYEQFLDDLVEEMDCGWIVCGYDFTFGKKGEGNAEKLSKYCENHGIGCDIIPQVTLDGQVVSSTYIRELISSGQMEEANRFLGHPHCISDTIHSGYHIGRKMNAPTINMYISPSVIYPKFGVYATRAVIDDSEVYDAVTNVGVRPTFGDENTVTVETHLLDYSGNLYGKPARIDFYKFMRPEMKFDNIESLEEQIKNDSNNTKKYLQEIKKA